MAQLKRAFVAAARRSLPTRYRDYVTRNWPLAWSLRIEVPILIALGLVLGGVLYALAFDLSPYRALDIAQLKIRQEQLERIHVQFGRDRIDLTLFGRHEDNEARLRLAYARLREAAEQARRLKAEPFPTGPAPTDRPASTGNAPVELPPVDEYLSLRKVISGDQVVMEAAFGAGHTLLTTMPFLGSLALCGWYFLVARSMKFIYAPRLGYQPRLGVLLVVGVLVLGGGLCGFKLFQWRLLGTGPLDFSRLGGVLWQDYRQPGLEFATALPFLLLAVAFVSVASTFTVVYRVVSLGAAVGSLALVALWYLAVSLLESLRPIGRHTNFTELALSYGWIVALVACAIAFVWSPRLRGTGAVATAAMLYLLSVGPVWLAMLSFRGDLGFTGLATLLQFCLPVLVSVLAGEAWLWFVNRVRIAPG